MNKKNTKTTTSDTMEKFMVWLTHDQMTWLREHQQATDAPIAATIRRALDAYRESLPKPKR